MLSTPSLLLISLLTSLTTAQTLNTACSTFNLTRSTDRFTSYTYTSTSSRSYQISADIICPANQSNPDFCTATTGGWVTDAPTLSIDSASSAAESLYALILTSTNNTLSSHASLANVSSYIQPNTYPVNASQTGHVNFTPFHRCVNGTLGGCAQQPDLNGLLVEACAPLFIQSPSGQDTDTFQGDTNFVVTDVSESEALKCNPANTTSAAEAPDYNCVHQANGTGTATSSAAPSVTSASKAAGRGVGIGGVGAVAGAVGVMVALL